MESMTGMEGVNFQKMYEEMKYDVDERNQTTFATFSNAFIIRNFTGFRDR